MYRIVLLALMCLSINGCTLDYPCPTSDARPLLYDAGQKVEHWHDLTSFFATLNSYEGSGDPLILNALGFFYAAGFGDFPTDEERNKKVIALYTQAARCGETEAIQSLSQAYRFGRHGVEVREELANCLDDAATLDSFWAARYAASCLRK